MKKLISAIFALVMIFSVVFISGAISSDKSFSAEAQTVRVRRRHNGVAHKTYRGGRYVVRKTVKGTRWTAHKTKVGTKWTAHKTKVGTKKVFHKTKKILY